VSDERLDTARTCLLLFDLLEGHVNRDDATRSRFRPVIANAEALLHAARVDDVMVAYAHADHRADRATSARTLRDTDNRLVPLRADDAEGHKPLITAGTAEAQIVRELSPEPGDYLVPKHRWSAFHGTYLDLALRDLDYNLVIASDACTSPEEDNHLQFMRRVFPRMARVRTTARILAMLSR
jgi:nicotinamidase-related amidase